MSGLRASIRLYGLVKNLGSSDNPNHQPVDILCTVNRMGCKAIRAFVSRLDAELMARSAGYDDYRVIPLRTFDPNGFIDVHQGWLSLHVCCGFVAPAGQSMFHQGVLSPMGWYVYSETGRWTAERYASPTPMPNHPYAIQRADGSVEHGVTNDAGFTHTVSSHLPESIKLFVE